MNHLHKVAVTVGNFMQCFPSFQEQDTAFNKCKFASYELAKILRSQGIDARLCNVKGYKGNPETAHDYWRSKPSRHWQHYMIRVGDTMIDITAKQFDPEFLAPRIQAVEQVKKQWNIVRQDDFLNGWLREFMENA